MNKNLWNYQEKYIFDYSTRKMLDQLYFVLFLSGLLTMFSGYIFLYLVNLILNISK